VLKETFTFERVSNPESIKKLIHDQLRQYKKIDEADLVVGDVDLSEFEPVVVVPIEPTAEEVALATYANKLAKFHKYRKALELNIIEIDDVKYQQLLKYLQNNFDDTLHLDLIY